MSKSDVWEADSVKLLFNATAVANIADNAATSPITSLFVSLHTADPGEAGNQTTSETSYGAYARQSVARTSGGWTVTNNTAVNAGIISFPQCTSGSATLTHFGVGTLVSGTGKLLYSGALAASLAVSTGIAPQFAASAISCSED